MIHTKDFIFPTYIHTFDNVLEEEYIESMKKDIIHSSLLKERGNWQSGSKIHKEPKYKMLVNKINEASKFVLNDNFYIYDSFEITGMWSNILKPGEMHRPHTHSNNILSGVYYVESDASANIQFYDPRPQAGVIMPNVKKWDKENSTVWRYGSITNRIILFPSWLQHYVPVNTSNNNRISIAFNVMLKGMVGKSEDYQSAEF